MENERLQIRAVMKPFPYTIGVQQTLEVAKSKMAEHRVRHLPVQKGGELVGVLSERDIHFAVAVDKKEPGEISVADCYTPEPYIVAPNETIDKVARRMAHDQLGCTLVVDKHKLVGIFTTVDACRTLAEIVSDLYEQ